MDSVVFTDEFIHHPDKQSQWSAFCRKKVIKNAPAELSLVATEVFTFLKPIMQVARERMPEAIHFPTIRAESEKE
jgi:hypothetical protein